jgi:vancomycin resistance protein VanJ
MYCGTTNVARLNAAPSTGNAVPSSRRPRQIIALLAWGYLALLLTAWALPRLVARADGVIALGAVLAPFLLLPALALLPLAFARVNVLLRLTIVLVSLAALAPFLPPGTVAARPAPAGGAVTLLTWNAYAGNQEYAGVRDFLAAQPAAIVTLQELSSAWAARFNSDPAIARVYPYRLLPYKEGIAGTAILSAYPIVATGLPDTHASNRDDPQALWARIRLPAGHVLTVVTAHPWPPDTVTPPCARPLCYAPYRRNAQLAVLRQTVDRLRQTGDPLVLAGDFNLTDREPAYRALTAGLDDAFARAGQGRGATWRPLEVASHAPPLLRIDYLLTSGLTPLTTAVNCAPPGSDHCGLVGQFGVGQTGSRAVGQRLWTSTSPAAKHSADRNPLPDCPTARLPDSLPL